MRTAHPGYHCLHLYATHTFHRFLQSASRKPTETIMVGHKRSEEAELPHIKLEKTAADIADILLNSLQHVAIPSKADIPKPRDDSDLTDKIKADKSDAADLGEESELVMKWGEAMATMCEDNHRGLYLLLMSFYHQIDHRRQLLKLSECRFTSDVQALQPFLRGLPECKTLTSQALASYLNQDHPEPVFRLTKWM
ncbi:hypothetical protein EAF04_001821 [Stromatinia cepivora]|nr:hypothetical protein EAF04_001821 [Stromatinia cepivora]